RVADRRSGSGWSGLYWGNKAAGPDGPRTAHPHRASEGRRSLEDKHARRVHRGQFPPLSPELVQLHLEIALADIQEFARVADSVFPMRMWARNRHHARPTALFPLFGIGWIRARQIPRCLAVRYAGREGNDAVRHGGTEGEEDKALEQLRTHGDLRS